MLNETAPTGRSLLTTKTIYAAGQKEENMHVYSGNIFHCLCLLKNGKYILSIYMYATCILEIIENGSVSNAKIK